MRNLDFLDDESVRKAFNRFCGNFASGFINDPEQFYKAFAEEIRGAYKNGWHRGFKDAPLDDF